jgi:hypothetical protein
MLILLDHAQDLQAPDIYDEEYQNAGRAIVE